MFNSEKPNAADLPSSRQLLVSTLTALALAMVLLVTVVMPAEYALDPTGVGRWLGLTQMGEIKAQLSAEAVSDAARDAAVTREAPTPMDAATLPEVAADQPSIGDDTAAPIADPTPSTPAWTDEMQVVLQPGEGAEIKLMMKGGERADFHWRVDGGVVNFDTHGDGGGQSISYEKGRGVPSDEGVLEAAFDGNHGWFWRNRGASPVTVIVRVRGQYADIKRMV